MDSTEQQSAENSRIHAVSNWLWRLITFGSGIGIAISLAGGFLARTGWAFELMSHFRLQYCIGLGICCLVLACGRRWKMAVATGVLAIVWLATLIPYLWGEPPDQVEGPPQRILIFNVHTSNTNRDQIIDFVRETNAEFVVLIEINESWARALSTLRSEYPYSRIAPRAGAFGMAILSKLPVERFDEFQFGGTDGPTIVAHVNDGSRSFKIVGTHTLPPVSPRYAELRNQHLQDVATYCAHQKDDVMVVGDLNITSWSPYFADMLATSGLKDSRLSFGIQASWPARRLPLRIPIDHCLVSKQIVVTNRRVGASFGSDHLPVIVEFHRKP